MSQSIALGNVGAVNFNGSTVNKINLNGSSIWEGGASYTFAVGYRSIPDSKTNAGVNYTGIGNTYGIIVSSDLPLPSPAPYFKGHAIVNIINQQFTTGNYKNHSVISIAIEGIHSRNLFSSIKIGSTTYYTNNTSSGQQSAAVIDSSGFFSDYRQGFDEPIGPYRTRWEWSKAAGNNQMPVGSTVTVVIT